MRFPRRDRRPPTGSVRTSTSPPAQRLNESRRLRALLTAAVVLWAGPALAQTVTISPTTAQTLREGEALEVTLTVNGLSTGQVASIDFPHTDRTASTDDFEVYQQATEPSGSDTPVALTVLDSGYAYYDFATDSDPTGPVTFWVLAKTDSVIVELDETLVVKGIMYVPSPFIETAASSDLTVTLTDTTPLPDPTGKPTAPSILVPTAGRGTVRLIWSQINDHSSNTNLLNDVNISKHQVRQSTDGGTNYGTWTDIPDSGYGGSHAVTYTIDNLPDGTQYTFQVRAVNGCTTTPGCGESDPSPAATAVTRAAARYRIETIAGGVGDGGPATAAQFEQPNSVALDASGRVYFPDAVNNRVRLVTSSGVITTVAGTGVRGYSGDGGPATEAMISAGRVALDSSGNLYIAGGHRIRTVDTSGVITTVAGIGTNGISGDGGQATAASVGWAADVAVDSSGNLYIAQSGEARIRKVDTAGVITTIAAGDHTFGGDGGRATAALLNRPFEVALDSSGNLYIADTENDRIRKVDTRGRLSTIAGTRVRGFAGDRGLSTNAQLYEPRGVAVDRAGNIYIADTRNNRIRKLTPPPSGPPSRPPSGPPPPPPNQPPTVTLSCAPCEVERGGEAMLTATASDPDGDPLTYAWSISAGVITGADDTAAVRWTAPDRFGTVTIRVRVSDGEGGADEAQVAIEVLVVLPERTSFDISYRGTATFTTGGQADSPRAGYGLIRADRGMATPSGIALFQYRDSDGVLITEASVPAAVPVRQGRIFAEVGDAVNTAVAFANPNRQSVDISFYLTDTEGSRSAEGSFTLEANQHLAGLLNAPPFEVAGMVGTFSFQASAPLAVIALRGAANEAGEWLGTTLPVTPPLPPAGLFSRTSTDPVVFPHFADGQGWSTQVILVNPTRQPIGGTLEFLGTDAAPLTVTLDDGRMGTSFPYSIAAHSAWRVVTANSADRTASGSVRATPASGLPRVAAPSGLLVYSFTAGGKTVSHVGVPALPSSTAFRIPIAAAGEPGQPGSIRTVLAVANPADVASTVSLEITRPDGSLLLPPASFALRSGGQATSLLDEVIDLPQDFSSGLLRVSASNGEVSLAALRFRVNRRGELKTTSIWPQDETAPVTSEDRYFAHLADSGGWSTRLILFSGTFGESGSGTLSLFWFPVE